MKRIFLTGLAAALILGFFPAGAQEKEEPRQVLEEIEVVNVEVPVRVFAKKNPVKGLKKEDFKLYIDGEEREIHGFFEVRKKISTPPEAHMPRLFVLMFNVSSYGLDLEKGLHTFFEKVIRPGDRLMVMTNNVFLNERRVDDPKKEMEKIIKILDIETARMGQGIRSLEFNLRYLATSFQLDFQNTGKGGRSAAHDEAVIRRFIDNYKEYYEEFKSKFFDPNEKMYLRVADQLKRQKYEKWVLHFYQTPVFPHLNHLDVMYKIIENFFSSVGDMNEYTFDAEIKMSTPDKSRVDTLSKIFLNTGATFHTLLMKPFLNEFFEGYTYRPVAVDSEYISRETAKLTGGSILYSIDVEKFIKKISRQEDVYYMLTYVPRDKGEKSKLKVKVSNPAYRVVYDDHQRPRYLKKMVKTVTRETPQVRFRKLLAKDGVLFALISGVQLETAKDQGEQKQGKLFLNIKVLNDQAQEISGAKKGFTCTSETVPIRLRLPVLEKGQYRMLIEVNDLVTGRNDLEFLEIRSEAAVALETGHTAYEFITGPVPVFPGLETGVADSRGGSGARLFEDILPGSTLTGDAESSLTMALSKKEIDPGILPSILADVAVYCERLKAGSLDFFCIEEINESQIKALEWRGKSRKVTNRFTYGYQLIKGEGKTREKRTLFNRNGDEQVEENVDLLTHFKYRHIIYGPLIFNRAAQAFYRYDIIGKREWKGKTVYIIEAVPRSSEGRGFVSGRFWVDAEDYSILRIEIYQNSLANFGEIQRLAGQHNVEPCITIINEYEIVKKGIRFPSKLYYEEAYKDKGGKLMVQSVGNVTFRDYQFFNIETKVTKEQRQ